MHLTALVDPDKVNAVVSKIDDRIYADLKKSKLRKFSNWRIPAAAALLLFFGIFSWIFFQNRDTTSILDVPAPIGSNAVIVLDDNSEIELDELKKGDTIFAKGYTISRDLNGAVVYHSKAASPGQIYNTIRTKAGGLSNIMLADGSHIWINSKSEIRYPVEFSKSLREVYLSGEAYFEVNKDSSRPFVVRSAGQTIKVLGTRFNVNLLTNSPVSTLLEGKIALSSQGSSLGEPLKNHFPVLLKPGEQYQNGNVALISEPQKIIDWKEGYFDFTGYTLQQMGDKLENWYGINIEIDANVKNLRLTGQINRSKSIRQVIELLKSAFPIDYEITNNKVKITKKSIY